MGDKIKNSCGGVFWYLYSSIFAIINGLVLIVFEKLYEREKLGTTAFGNGIAIPHARIDNLSEARIIILMLETAIDFDSSDGKKVDLIISLLAPNNKNEIHIKILSKIAEMLDDKDYREKIRNCSNKTEIKSVINSYQKN